MNVESFALFDSWGGGSREKDVGFTETMRVWLQLFSLFCQRCPGNDREGPSCWLLGNTRVETLGRGESAPPCGNGGICCLLVRRGDWGRNGVPAKLPCVGADFECLTDSQGRMVTDAKE